MWEKDSYIDRLNLSEEILKISSYHAKYYKLYVHEVLLLKKMEEELRELRLQKYEFFTMGPHEGTPDDWELPVGGKKLKNEVQPYIDSDKQVISKTLLVGLQKEKTQFLKSILDSLVARGYNINGAITFARFQAGV